MTDEFFYRFEDRRVSDGVDEWGDSYGSHIEVYLHKYKVVKHTPKGVWIRRPSGCRDNTFILTAANKRFALPTIEEARVSFLARKNKQIGIYTHRILDAKAAIAKVNQDRRWGEPNGMSSPWENCIT